MYQKNLKEILPDKTPCLLPDASLTQAVNLLRDTGLSDLMVRSKENKILGTVGEREIIKAMHAATPQDGLVSSFMQENLAALGGDSGVVEAGKKLLTSGLRCLLVCLEKDGGHEVLSTSHIIEALAVEFMCENVECGMLMDSSMLTFRPDSAVRELLGAFAESGKSGAVITENGAALGVVTERDVIMRGFAQGLDLDTPLKRIMSSPALVVPDFGVVYKVILFMNQKKVRRVVVLDSAGVPSGLLGHFELLSYCENFANPGESYACFL